MRLLLPDRAEARALDLPAAVETVFYDPTGDPPDVSGVEFAVVDWGPPARLAALLGRLQGVRVVQTLSAGVDWLGGPVPAGATLCDASGVHDIPVAEWVVGAVLAIAKGFPHALDAQRAASWEPYDTDDLEDATVLILGHGSIGRAVEARLAPFGVRFERIARSPREGVHGIDALPDLLPRADVLVVLLPLTDATRGLLGADALARLKRGALLVNAARGAIVDADALVAALGEGRLRAALDVTDPEPLPPDHPLWSAPNLLLTPHVAGNVPRFLPRAFALVRDQVQRHLAGEPLVNVVREGY